MPSDHVIRDNDAFLAAVMRAVPAALGGHLVTFGIEPTSAETGFGYIHAGEALDGVGGAFSVEAFIEKPDQARAQQMLSEGGHCWNAGIFLFNSGVFLAELGRHHPEVLDAARASIQRASKWDRITAPQADKFAASPSISVDYAVMELSDRVAVVPVSCGWSDLGSWDALAEIGGKDSYGNVIIGDVRADGCSGSLINTSGMRVSALGVKDTIVVVSGGEVLIMPRGSSQRVKDFAH
jgi:mannose-1-phosphate guanylyltransferase/mannose-6-phosphate isomerase